MKWQQWEHSDCLNQRKLVQEVLFVNIVVIIGRRNGLFCTPTILLLQATTQAHQSTSIGGVNFAECRHYWNLEQYG